MECREAANENLGSPCEQRPLEGWRLCGVRECGPGAMRCVVVTGWGPGSAALHRVHLAGSCGTTRKPPIFFPTKGSFFGIVGKADTQEFGGRMSNHSEIEM